MRVYIQSGNYSTSRFIIPKCDLRQTEMKTKNLNKKSYFSEDQRLSIVIEQNPAAMVITDLGGNIEYSNAKFTELTGYTAEEALGMNSSALKSGKTDPKVYKELWSTILNGKTWRGEFINRKKNGDEYIENAVISPIFDKAGNTINYLALYDDITEQRRVEAKVLEQQAELEKLNEFTRIINSTIDTATILKEIYTYICERTGFDIVWILLVNKKKNQVFSDSTLSIFGSPEKLDFDYFSHFRKKINESLGVIYQTYKNRVPFYFSNAYNFKRTVTNVYNGEQYKLRRTDFEIQRKGNLQSMLQIPLILQDEVIGILNLTVQDKIIEIQSEDIKKLMRFADQIAGVIFNAHLVEEMQEAKRDAEIAEKIALMAQKEMEQEKIKSDQLLLNILPEEIARELRENGSTAPVHYKSVSVMFTDFKGFTQIAETMTPNELINELDSCFSYFDSLMDRFKLEKLKTIGDSYMCAGGIPIINNTHPVDAILAALEIQAVMNEAKKLRLSMDLPFWELRLGIHTGSLIAGVIGEKKFAYDVWGDTVNIASRMEASGTPEMVNISKSTYEIVKDFFHCEYRGKIPAKNKGYVEMYYVRGIRSALSLDEECRIPSFRFWILYDRLRNGEPLNVHDLKDRRIGRQDTRLDVKERRRISYKEKNSKADISIEIETENSPYAR